MSVDVLCIGHAAIDCSLYMKGFPEENQKYEIYDLLSGTGGPAANAALLLGRWGVRCAFAGVVGDDLYGRQVIVELKAANVDVSAVEIRAGCKTPASTILVNTINGSRTIINHKDVTAPLSIASAKARMFAPKIILTDGHELPAALTALEENPEAYSILDAGSAREGTLTLAEKVNALIASERFSRQVTAMLHLEVQSDPKKYLNYLQKRFNRKVTAITLGERGVIADWGQQMSLIPAPQVVTVDTTAAGDIFHGACAYGMVQNWPWEKILTFAAQTAALSVTKRGGSTSIPSLHEVMNSNW